MAIHIKGKTVTLKLKTIFFQVKQYSHTLGHPVCQSFELFQAVGRLLQDALVNSTSTPLKLRLMGINNNLQLVIYCST